MGEEEKFEVEESGGKKGLPMIVVILVVAILAFGGGIAVYKFFLSPKPQQDAKQGETQTKAEEGEKAAEEKKAEEKTSEQAIEDLSKAEGDAGTEIQQAGILPLEPFIVNLNDPIGRRYLKLTLKLELRKKEYEDKIRGDDLLMSKIRDTIFLILSSKTYDELRTVSGKLSLKQEIITKVNSVISSSFDEEPVTGCFFTEFVIQ